MEGQHSLKGLSRRHHQDRQKCSQIMNTIHKRGDREVVKKEILAFWNSNLKKHVDSEESVLIPFLAKHDFNNEYVNVLRREHDTIRTLAQRIPLHDDGYYLYKAFITLVDQHISFEEEVVLKKMKEQFSDQELSRLEATLEQKMLV